MERSPTVEEQAVEHFAWPQYKSCHCIGQLIEILVLFHYGFDFFLAPKV